MQIVRREQKEKTVPAERWALSFAKRRALDKRKMDLRELIRMKPEDVVGHKPVTERLNVKDEFRRFNADPLRDCLKALEGAWGHPLKGTCQEKKVFLA